MMKSEIEVGGFYTDGKAGLREVTAVGSEYALNPGQDDGDCILFRYLASRDGRAGKHNCTRSNFASWAKARVPADQVVEVQMRLQAEAVRLSAPLADLMASFGWSLPLAEMTIPKKQWRAAALYRKGLLYPVGANDKAILAALGADVARTYAEGLGARG